MGIGIVIAILLLGAAAIAAITIIIKRFTLSKLKERIKDRRHKVFIDRVRKSVQEAVEKSEKTSGVVSLDKLDDLVGKYVEAELDENNQVIQEKIRIIDAEETDEAVSNLFENDFKDGIIIDPVVA